MEFGRPWRSTVRRGSTRESSRVAVSSFGRGGGVEPTNKQTNFLSAIDRAGQKDGVHTVQRREELLLYILAAPARH